MPTITDQMGRQVLCPQHPQRIISLVPSQTELLMDLGLGNRLVGRTKFCIHPADQLANITVIGGTKNFRFEQIDALSPDLIIGNKEENYEEGIAALAEKYPVLMSDIFTLTDALQMIQMVGTATGTAPQTADLLQKIEQEFNLLMQAQTAPKRVLYLIWKNPYMAAGGNTFISDMISRMGWHNVLGDTERYPQLTDAQIQALQPDVILLSSEPYPFSLSKDAAALEDLCPSAQVLLVDGEMFSWYGSRLRFAPRYLMDLLS
ncbi:ABC-type Fe3+-hydroxamate transport system, substrate-binding protein [Flexibacter flexilis DSM 6793]|uniref:ABC-type Fe3+-hydroxamate transport system, substrate-binding protein n=1 Tax=Flexibacter flexilis DSM 6793 TaxID=927664 RepID=A0A1I1G8D8_9BACT|nr:helical backbone metal receptor [Flexibacter flexilis]SFC07844.1 ABC-type Fe3+-hydroxamate transport system, substrate-binding protein [Flexibacter flexilis DSM 6793]